MLIISELIRVEAIVRADEQFIKQINYRGKNLIGRPKEMPMEEEYADMRELADNVEQYVRAT